MEFINSTSYILMHTLQKRILDLTNGKEVGQITLRELGRLIGEEHPQKVKHHLSQLEMKGYIQVRRNANLLEIINLHKTFDKESVQKGMWLDIPILGSANCGPATIYADEVIEGYVRVSETMVPSKKGLFAIKAVGDSMNRANIDERSIEDGDYVIVDSTYNSPKSADYILSVMDGVANIKKYIFDRPNKQIMLISESNKEFPPIYIHPDDEAGYKISGKVISVLKKPKG